MAEKLTSKQQKEQLNNLFAIYNRRLGRLYSDYVKKLTSLGYGEDVLEDDALFSFDNFPNLKARLNDIFNDYFQNNVLCYKNGITDGVALAYNHDSAVLSGFSIMSNKALKAARNIAAETFISNRLNSKQGLNLAQTVWNYCQQTKSEFEMAMSNVIADGLKKGTSAEEVGKSIRRYLNNPDMMYRRYHTIKIQKNGQKKDVVTWRRKRIIDGKVRFVEEPLEKVGMGVYRSSRKNALRVARTEINSAYHKARNERWQNEPFVIGQWIHVSPQHEIDDICNDLEGRYPKGFPWDGWHPSCMCTSDPILISGEEKKKFYDRLYAGEDMSGYISPYTVNDVPDNYKKYIRDNAENIVNAQKRGKLAWHLVNSRKYWENLLSAAQLKEMGFKPISSKNTIMEAARIRHAKRDVDKIQRQWTLRRSAMYMDKMNNDLAKLVYTDYKTMGEALKKRYDAVLGALKSENTWSVENMQRLYKRFQNGISTRQRWDKLLWDGFSKEQIENCRELEKRLGILKGRPMSWERADQQNANPGYIPNVKNGYQINCATCSPTYMMRLMGFNVTADNYSNALVEYLSKGSQIWEKWLNPDGTQATWVQLNQWKNARNYKEMTALRYKEFIEDVCKETGVYEMSIGWSKGGGHSTIIQRFADGSLKCVDAQVYCQRYYGVDEKINLVNLCKHGEAHLKGWKGFIHECRGIMRIDDKLFNPAFAKIFQVVK
jgi:hypothetical protein